MARWPPGWHASSQASSQALAGWLSQVSGEEFVSSCACVCVCVLVQCSHLEAWHAMATEMPPKAAATKQLNGALCSRAPVMAGCGLACLSRPAAVGCYAGSLSTTSGVVHACCVASELFVWDMLQVSGQHNAFDRRVDQCLEACASFCLCRLDGTFRCW